jgi:hypothetical protein
MWTLKFLLIGFAAAAFGHAELLCTANAPVAANDETIHVTAYLVDESKDARYAWTATGGQVNGQGAHADWTFSGVKPGLTYTINVTMRDGSGGEQHCSLQVTASFGSRGERETGRVLLARSQHEEAGFGLYSYLLFGSAPDDSTRERYLNAVKVYLRLTPAIEDLRKFLDLKQLNANYLPVTSLPAEGVKLTAEWLLENYDYARARGILRVLDGPHFRGPYIVSVLKPADPRAGASRPIFFQDLSVVPPDLIAPWYEIFLNQAAQQRFWETKATQQFTLRVRTIIGVLSRGIPDVKSGLAAWIQWLN